MTVFDRRRFLSLALATPALAAPVRAFAAPTELRVARSPTCGCCGAWVERMRDAGFAAVVRDVPDHALYGLKAQAGLDRRYWSCHTAFVDSYVIEGHVPAEDIRRLIDERPDVLGLAAPGMPIGSPGMELGGETEPYDVLLLDRSGGASVFASHG